MPHPYCQYFEENLKCLLEYLFFFLFLSSTQIFREEAHQNVVSESSESITDKELPVFSRIRSFQSNLFFEPDVAKVKFLFKV